jgi:hypothetical protein
MFYFFQFHSWTKHDMELLRSTLFGNQTKNRAALFLLPNIERSHSILRICNGAIPFYQITEPNDI